MGNRSANARSIAVLRGIHVGGRRVGRERLRGLLVDLTLSDVSTFIASGEAYRDVSIR